MAMKSVHWIVIPVFCVTGALAQESAKPGLSGTWALQTDPSTKLIVEQVDSAIHIREMRGSQTIADYKCNMDGKDCAFKEEGHAGKVAVWFNGPKMVELRTHGDNVVRRRFTLAGEGKMLEVELSLISPPGKSEVLAYTRQ